jgi:glycosyltransferase involved in cell wall biosynthesis
MHILILTHFLGRGGSSSFAVQVRDRLRQEGYHVVILATQYTDDCISDDADFLLHKQRPFRSETIQRLLKRIQEIKPDLVYSISGTLEMEVLRFLKIPRVRHFSSLESHEILDIRHIFCQAAPYFEGVTANTPDVLDTVKSWLPQLNYKTGTFPYNLKLPLLPDGSQSTKVFSDRAKQICYIGRLENIQKRAHWLPDIIAKIAKTSHLVDWHIYGDGPLNKYIATQIKQIHPAVSVIFHNWVSQSDLIKLLPSHDLFFLCSKWEGLPIAMVESMLCGVACLVPDTCAGAGYALDSGGGWMYRADSPASCGAELVKILDDPSALELARKKAANSAKMKFIGDAPALQTKECINMLASLKYNGRADNPNEYRSHTPLPPMRNLRRRISYFNSLIAKKLTTKNHQ